MALLRPRRRPRCPAPSLVPAHHTEGNQWRSGPERRTRSAPRTTAAACNFALFSEVAERVELCLIDDDGAETAPRPARGRRLRLARLRARPAARPALRLPRARALRPRARPPLRPEQAAARPVRQGDRGPGRRRPVAVLLRLQEPQRSRNTDDSLGHDDALGRHQPLLRLGPRPPAAPRVPRDASSTRRTSRA